MLLAEQQGPLPRQFPSPIASPQQPPQPSQPPAQPDVRPLKDRSNKPDKTCIWVKYRQYKLSALIDTGSDVSIASEDIARRMGWKIHAHRITEVCVANNNTMSVSGVVRVPLRIGNYRTDSEILISPDFEGLILGSDWITQQGRLDWDVSKNRMRIGTGDWIQVHSGEPFIKVRRIFATKDIVIPAWGQVNVAARIMHNAWSCTMQPASYGIMESQPVSTVEHVYSGRTLLPTQTAELQVPVLNARAQDVTVIQGTLLGKVFTADTVAQSQPNHVRRIQAGETISPAHEEVIQQMVDGLPSELTSEQREKVRELLIQHRTILSLGDHDVGRTHLVEHTIDTGDHRPIRQALRRQPFQHQDYICLLYTSPSPRD